MRAAYSAQSHVLALIERTDGTPSEADVEAFAADAKRRLTRAEQCYKDAADKVARMVYVGGMVLGVFLLAPLAAAAALLIWIFGAPGLHSSGTQAFFACIAAGALGAVVSVLSRMGSQGKF